MTDSAVLIPAIVLLAVGTYATRLLGPVLRRRMRLALTSLRLMAAAAVVLLTAVLAVSTFTDGDGFAGVARPAGVLVAGILAWRRAPFAVIVIAAAVTTALLRLMGVP
jgi:branched chain amino acid efflux pump